MHVKVINFRGYVMLYGIYLSSVVYNFVMIALQLHWKLIKTNQWLFWVFQKYAKISLRNICLNFPSKKINPRENFAEVAIWRNVGFELTKFIRKIFSIKTRINCGVTSGTQSNSHHRAFLQLAIVNGFQPSEAAIPGVLQKKFQENTRSTVSFLIKLQV